MLVAGRVGQVVCSAVGRFCPATSHVGSSEHRAGDVEGSRWNIQRGCVSIDDEAWLNMEE